MRVFMCVYLASSRLGLRLRRRRGRGEWPRRPCTNNTDVTSAARKVGPCRTCVMCAARPNSPAALATCCSPAGPSPASCGVETPPFAHEQIHVASSHILMKHQHTRKIGSSAVSAANSLRVKNGLRVKACLTRL